MKKQETFCFALPFHNKHFKSYTNLLDKIGSHWANHFGIVYVLVAKKRLATITPIGSSWYAQAQATLVPEGVGT